MSLQEKRRAIQKLIDQTNPSDAMAAYYAFYHDDDRTSIITDQDVLESKSEPAEGYVAVSRTGIDLFRPLITTRLNIDDLEKSAQLLKAALPPGAEAFLAAPINYDPLIRAIFEVKSEQKLLLYTYPHGIPDPIVNIFVSQDGASKTPRFIIKQTLNGQNVIVSSAGVNWMTHNYVEIAVRTWSEYRRKGMAKSVVNALTRNIIENGRRPIYAVQDSNHASIDLARTVGFQDSGFRQLMFEVQAR
ncbi:MAG: GNAT family N-acetyltransferase [Chloroflexota bacterium]